MSINYRVLGEGFPMVMLHGWPLDHQVLLHCMEPVFKNRNNWKRIYIDLPGMGHSEPQSWIENSDDMLKAVLGLLDDLIPEEPFAVCGNSYGAYIARGMVHFRRNLARGLLLMAPMTIPEVDNRKLPSHIAIQKDTVLMSRLSKDDAEEFGSVAVVQGQYQWERFRDEILLPLKQANEVFLTQVLKNGYGFSFDIAPISFEYPTLIITGRQDHVVGYQDPWRLIEQYPRATFAVLDMAGHNLQIEQPDVFEVLVHNWLNRLELEKFL
ncbi:alpha/beta hydrolase [Alicyclobacillaceae bacterium I2511]|nr:alpha/beta hydrolase [Alicyclobacillaceae bacterium I2511]